LIAKPVEISLGNYRLELEELVLEVAIHILKQEVGIVTGPSLNGITNPSI